MISFYAVSTVLCAGQLSCDRKIRKPASQRAQNLVERFISPPSDSSWHITCLETLLSCEIYAVSSSRVVVTLERNLLRLRSNCN